MPSGARKRKAAKKKGKKGKPQSHNSTSITTTTNDGSSTHSQGSDDVRSMDGRESDFSEIEHEAKGETVSEGRKVETGGCSKSEGQGEENVEVERESKSQGENPIGGVDSSRVDEARIGNMQEKEVTVEPYAEEGSKQQDDSGSVIEKGPLSEAMVQEVYNMEERVPVIESVKEVVASPEEGNNITNKAILSEGSTKSEPVESWKEDLKLSDEKNEIPIPSLATVDTQKTETEVFPTVDQSFDKLYSNREGSEDKMDVGVPAAGTSGGREQYAIKDMVDQRKSPEKVIETNREMTIAKNGESLKDSDEQSSASVVRTSPGVNDNGKHSEDQPLIGSTGMPVRRTSWLSCCGLFEVFSGSR